MRVKDIANFPIVVHTSVPSHSVSLKIAVRRVSWVGPESALPAQSVHWFVFCLQAAAARERTSVSTRASLHINGLKLGM